jgi:hypothetical protein
VSRSGVHNDVGPCGGGLVEEAVDEGGVGSGGLVG